MTPSQKNEKALAALQLAIEHIEGDYPVYAVSAIQEAIAALSQPTTGDHTEVMLDMVDPVGGEVVTVFTEADLRAVWKASRLNALHGPFSGFKGEDESIHALIQSRVGGR